MMVDFFLHQAGLVLLKMGSLPFMSALAATLIYRRLHECAICKKEGTTLTSHLFMFATHVRSSKICVYTGNVPSIFGPHSVEPPQTFTKSTLRKHFIGKIFWIRCLCVCVCVCVIRDAIFFPSSLKMPFPFRCHTRALCDKTIFSEFWISPSKC